MQTQNIGIIGYGKMGKEIESLAREQGHQVVVIIDNEDDWHLKGHLLQQADVAIEFTTPQQAPKNIEKCFELGTAVVCGTTGWYHELPRISELCLQTGQTLFYAPNFSIGVNIFFEVNRKLAGLMSDFSHYAIKITETHHTRKLDAPSGTAVHLANDIINQRTDLQSWVLAENRKQETEIPIEAVRINDVPGTHKLSYHSDIDSIDIQHTAHSRKGFTQGTLLAAAWVAKKKGVFTMKDLLNL